MISPFSSTMMALALRTVDRRWAMTKVVRFSMMRSMPFSIMRSVRVSTELVASSSTRIGALLSAARAMFSSCRWPCDRFAPSPSITVL